jgi:hypothetical protein
MVNLPAGDRDPGHGLSGAGSHLCHPDIEAAGGPGNSASITSRSRAPVPGGPATFGGLVRLVN